MPCEKNTINPGETNTSTFKSHTQVAVYEVCRKPVCNCVIEGEYNLWLNSFEIVIYVKKGLVF